MTADDLRKAAARFERAARRADEAREHRNRLVREALDAGWTHAQISDVTGLSRGRISQLVVPKADHGTSSAS